MNTVSIATRYLDLVKASVLGELYVENELRILYLRECAANGETPDPYVLRDILTRRAEMATEYQTLRAVGKGYRSLQNLGFQHTMIGRARLEHVHDCLRVLDDDGVPGDLIECGVWRGGTCVFMRAYLAACDIPDRTVWVADSFAGLPPPTHPVDAGLDLSQDKYPMLAIDDETVATIFRRYGLLDDRVRFLKGWFRDTLPSAPIAQLALLRLDGDLYESTMDTLDALYDRVAPGGFVIVDDFGAVDQCRRAIEAFRHRHAISAPITAIDWTGVYWRKPA
jgi:O-methyltransferase